MSWWRTTHRIIVEESLTPKLFYMNVQSIMGTNFTTVQEEATYKQVADLLHESEHGCVFVVNQTGQLVGLISEHDLFRILFPYYQSYYLNPEMYTDPKEREQKIEEVQDHPVSRFMCTHMHVATPDEPIMRAGATMLAKNIRRMPVIDQGKLVGVVTRRQIYRTLYEGHLKK